MDCHSLEFIGVVSLNKKQYFNFDLICCDKWFVKTKISIIGISSYFQFYLNVIQTKTTSNKWKFEGNAYG